MPNVTIQDVARRAGVSKGLVSLALNNRPGVAVATRQRVLDAASELGWIPNSYARGLSLRTTFTLGLVVRRDPSVLMANPFFASFITGVESVLSTRGWSLLLSVVPDQEAERDAYRNLAGNRADGFFLTDLRIDDPRPQLLAELGAQAVLVGPPQPDTDLPAVNLDDRPGVTASVEHLLRLGHRRIAHVTGDLRMVHGAGRLDAFRQALDRAGLAADLIQPGDFSAASGATATEALLAEPDPPTAIVYGSDSMAVAGLKVLQSAGARVPDDVSIVGFDGIELGDYLTPPLTTVRTDPVRWGVAAALLLCARLAGEAIPDHPDLPPAELLVRGSTAAPTDPGEAE